MFAEINLGDNKEVGITIHKLKSIGFFVHLINAALKKMGFAVNYG